MKKLITLLITSIALTGCDKKTEYSCAELDFIGTWRDNGDPNKYLYVNNDCTMSLPYCESDISFTLPDNDNLSIVSIHTANLGAGCVQPQDLQCRMWKSGVLFTMVCDTDDANEIDFSYTKQL